MLGWQFHVCDDLVDDHYFLILEVLVGCCVNVHIYFVESLLEFHSVLAVDGVALLRLHFQNMFLGQGLKFEQVLEVAVLLLFCAQLGFGPVCSQQVLLKDAVARFNLVLG